ncbi:MAG: S8 family serine peptidase [Saprospiraceae bacterium]
MLIQIDPKINGEEMLSKLDAFYRMVGSKEQGSLLTHPTAIKQISTSMNIWQLQLDDSADELVDWLSRQPEVLSVQKNHIIQNRDKLLPNDPLFFQQWQYLNNGSNGGVPDADLNADQAWEISTGGLSASGDTIVVAVIDGGINRTHIDLVQNLWVNRMEIPGDGIDNDGNGYVDDYKGWNVFSQNDNIQGISTTHGTPVSGIIGASGNNGTGVSGVNWTIKIMFVAGGNSEAEILAAYDYIIKARKRYNDTHGASGAFIVAANCSWGIDYGMPSDSPLWCEAFEKLGEVGIISVAATANNPVNVDLSGDLPTTCPSDYLLAVTSLNNQDLKSPNAAWGAQNIDLGAYGDGIFTTSPNSQYGSYSGTSFAAPHVAGAIGLLYSTPCSELIALAKYKPALAALRAKELVLESVKPNPSLENACLSGGRLDLYNLLFQFESDCPNCAAPVDVWAIENSPYSITVDATIINNPDRVDIRWRTTGSGNWQVVEDISLPYVIAGLEPCKHYEVSLRAACDNTNSSTWSPERDYGTSGCCSIPGFSWSATSFLNSVSIDWSTGPDFTNYKVLIRKKNTSNWQSFTQLPGTIVIPDLEWCTEYELKVQGWCLDSWITLLASGEFKTKGCGSCLEEVYCPAGATLAQEEWIASVQLNDWKFESGPGGGGYQNFAGLLADNPVIAPLSEVNFTLTPGFWGSPYKEYFRIFIDYNMDGDFDDYDELVFDPGFAQEGVVSGSFITPAINQTGTSRMRVIMKFFESDPTPPSSCGIFSFGQVEDYCIDLADLSSGSRIIPDSSNLLKIYPNPSSDDVRIEIPGINSNFVSLQAFDLFGKNLINSNLALDKDNRIYLDINSWESGVYLISIDVAGTLFRGKLIKL